VSDLERWANGEGPEPDGVRELLDAAQGVPNLTPEQRKRMRARLRTAIDEDDRAWARRRTMTWAGVGAIAALAVAAGVVLMLRLSRAHDPFTEEQRPTHAHSGSQELPEPSESRELPWLQEAPQPVLGYTPEPEDAGPEQRPAPR
jgi:hypothetical protein